MRCFIEMNTGVSVKFQIFSHSMPRENKDLSELFYEKREVVPLQNHPKPDDQGTQLVQAGLTHPKIVLSLKDNFWMLEIGSTGT